jgi:hypothetical protein
MEVTMKRTAMVAVVVAALLLTAGGAVAQTSEAEARLRADFQQLSVARKQHRDALLQMPGVVGVGTEVSRDDPTKIVISVYVRQSTPELRAQIESELSGLPVEIVEAPEGFNPL